MSSPNSRMVAGNSFDPHWCTGWQTEDANMYCAGKGTTICSLEDRLKEDEYIGTIFQWQNVFYILLAWGFFVVAKHLYRLPYLYMLRNAGLEGRDSELQLGQKLVSEHNSAVAISFTGYIIGLAMVFCAAIEDIDQGEGINTYKFSISGSSQSYNDWSDGQWNDQQGENVWQTVVWTFMGLAMLLIARFLNDIMSCDLNEAVEIARNQNLAAACMEGAAYVCTGLVAAGAISGRPSSWGADVGTAWIYFGLGQILYMGSVLKFRHSCVRDWDVLQHIREGNVAAGVAVACETISMAIVIYSSIYLSTSLAIAGTAVAIGGFANFLARLMADKLLLPNSPVADEISKDKNWGAALVCGSAQIANAIMIMAIPASSCDSLNDSFGHSLTSTASYGRIFEYYMIFLLPVIPFLIYSVRVVYPLGLTLSGGVPDLDFWLDDADDSTKDKQNRETKFGGSPVSKPDSLAGQDTVSSAESTPAANTGSGAGVEAGAGAEESVELADVTLEADMTLEADAGCKNKELTNEDLLKRCNNGIDRYNEVLAVEGHSQDIDVDSLLTHKDNKSIAISFSGYLIGVALMFKGTVSATIYDFPSDYDFDDQMADLLPTLLLMVFGVFFMILSHVINDKVIIPGMKNSAVLDGRHVSPAVGIVEAGSFIATGQILGAASYSYVEVDDSNSWGEAILMQFLWFILGQFVIVLMSFLSDSIYGGHAKQNVKKGGISSGIFLAMRLITAGTLVANPIGKSDSVVTFVVMVPLTFIFCQLGKYMFRISLACGSLFEDSEENVLSWWQIVVEGLPFKSHKNWGNALLEGFVFLSMANIFGAFLSSCDCYTSYIANINGTN